MEVVFLNIERKLRITIKIDGYVDVEEEHSLDDLNNYLKTVTNPILIERLAQDLSIDEEIISIESKYE